MSHKIIVSVVTVNTIPTIIKEWQDSSNPTHPKNGKYVYPKPGDGVRWVNDAAVDLVVTFPPGKWPFAQPQVPLTASAGQMTANLKVIKPWTDPNVQFAYDITVGNVKNDPDIIIDLSTKMKKPATSRKKAVTPKRKK
jgi:hypothetical protein